MQFQKHTFLFFLVTFGIFFSTNAQISKAPETQTIKLKLQTKIASEQEPEKYLSQKNIQEWNPKETAIVICDMWDAHWCKGATDRTAEMAPKMDRVVSIARDNGMLIVHSPGGCMKFYKNHPARNNALKLNNSRWEGKVNSSKLLTEKDTKWPIDDSDGGCDCDPECKQHHPWKRQIDIIQIRGNDLITDSGSELVSYLKATGIKNVILMGVHTNMCIVNRPYALRSMINSGFNAALMRDMTDAMYDSKQWPFVNHFEGTRLMIDYIEKYICPTILSSDFAQDKPFYFSGDL